jgi:hypothetical protein
MWKTNHLSFVDNFPREIMRFPYLCFFGLLLAIPWSIAGGGRGRLLLQARDRAVRRLRALRLPLPQQPLLSRGRVPWVPMGLGWEALINPWLAGKTTWDDIGKSSKNGGH